MLRIDEGVVVALERVPTRVYGDDAMEDHAPEQRAAVADDVADAVRIRAPQRDEIVPFQAREHARAVDGDERGRSAERRRSDEPPPGGENCRSRHERRGATKPGP